MAKQTSLFLHAGHNVTAVTFLPADTTTPKAIFTAGANDTDFKLGNATSTDTSTVNLQLFYRTGGVNYLLGTVPIVTLSGTNGTAPAVNLLNANYIPSVLYDPVNKAYIPVKAGDSIYAAPLATITTAKVVTVIAGGHDF